MRRRFELEHAATFYGLMGVAVSVIVFWGTRRLSRRWVAWLLNIVGVVIINGSLVVSDRSPPISASRSRPTAEAECCRRAAARDTRPMASSASDPETVDELRTPALVVDQAIFDANVSAIGALLPGSRLRPHVKAFKSTSLAKRLAANGHMTFCAATPREIEGMVAAGLGDDLLLANESLDVARLGALADEANITVAVDSDTTLDAAIAGGIRSVLIDVEVGLPRCGCSVENAGPLADRARAAGLEVRGVMGYEGHLMMVTDRAERTERVQASMAQLLEAHERVGGEIVSGGGTGTFDTNIWCTEIQAGSFTLMDTHYDGLDLPFQIAASVLATVISVSPKGWIVVDAGLKALGMDHGDPTWPDGKVFFCSDEHTTLSPTNGVSDWKVGDRTRLLPAHVDPTVAKHETMWVLDGDRIVDQWPVDLRGW